MDAQFISVISLSREDLALYQYPLGLYILRTPGLCAGLFVNPRHEAPGYIDFVRCEKINSTQTSSEQRNF